MSPDRTEIATKNRQTCPDPLPQRSSGPENPSEAGRSNRPTPNSPPWMPVLLAVIETTTRSGQMEPNRP